MALAAAWEEVEWAQAWPCPSPRLLAEGAVAVACAGGAVAVEAGGAGVAAGAAVELSTGAGVSLDADTTTVAAGAGVDVGAAPVGADGVAVDALVGGAEVGVAGGVVPAAVVAVEVEVGAAGVGEGAVSVGGAVAAVGSEVASVSMTVTSPPQDAMKAAIRRTAPSRITLRLRIFKCITNLSTPYHTSQIHGVLGYASPSNKPLDEGRPTKIYSSIPSSSKNAARFAIPCRIVSWVRWP